MKPSSRRAHCDGAVSPQVRRSPARKQQMVLERHLAKRQSTSISTYQNKGQTQILFARRSWITTTIGTTTSQRASRHVHFRCHTSSLRTTLLGCFRVTSSRLLLALRQ